MRQSTKEILQNDIMINLLNSCHVGRLGTISKDGYPIIKPLNFVYEEGKVYFHSAQEGEKINDVKRDNRVCFEVDLPIALVRSKISPCRYSYLYRSIIIKGKARIVDSDRERLFALKRLMEKFEPNFAYSEFPADKVKLTAVVRIDVEEMVGKEDLGKAEAMRETVRNALEQKIQLPIILERE